MAARRFAFETEFAPDGTILNDAAVGARRYTPEEVEAEKKAAYEQGKSDTIAAAERAAAAALKDIAMAAGALLQTLDAESKAMRGEAASLALAASRKIAGAALDSFGEARVLAAVEAAMDQLRHGPRLIVRVAAGKAETLKPRIDAMAEEHAYSGAVLVRAEPNLSAGAVSIDWSDGLVRIDPAELAERIDALITEALAGAEQGNAA